MTGDWVKPGQITNPEYWVRHISQTVRFGDSLRTLGKGNRVFLEIGPGSSCATLAQKQLPSMKTKVFSTMPSEKSGKPGSRFLLETLGHLWLLGLEPDWRSYYRGRSRLRIDLPTYSFQRSRYWLERPQLRRKTDEAWLLKRKTDFHDWFHLPLWTQLPLATSSQSLGSCLVFLDERGLGSALPFGLEKRGHRVLTVRMGASFCEKGDSFTINPSQPRDYVALVRALQERGFEPNTVLHLQNLGVVQAPERCAARVSFDAFDSLLFLAGALGQCFANQPLSFKVVGSGLFSVESRDPIDVSKALVLGPVKAIPLEFPLWSVSCIDVGLNSSRGQSDSSWLDDLLGEVCSQQPEDVVALRDGGRWARRFLPASLRGDAVKRREIRKGTYLVTGGLATMGLNFARVLACDFGANLVLTDHSCFPSRQAWPNWSRAERRYTKTGMLIAEFETWEQMGARVRVETVDETDSLSVEALVHRVEREWGPVRGVIHAAGILDAGEQPFQPVAQVCRGLTMKVYSALALEQVFRGRTLDFMVLCSSIASLTGSVEQVESIAANAFLDAFAHAHRWGRTPVFAINWTFWRPTDTSLEPLPDHLLRMKAERWELGVSAKEGGEILKFLLSHSPYTQIVISPVGIKGLAREMRKVTPPAAKAPPSKPIAAREPSKTMDSSNQDAERVLVNYWRELLGLDEIDPDRSFFELGGDSLLAARFVHLVETAFPGLLNANLIHQNLTIRQVVSAWKGGITTPKNGQVPVPNSPLLSIQEGENHGPLFVWVHPIGGDTYSYWPLVRALGKDVPFYGFQAPALSGGTSFKSIAEMADAYIAELVGIGTGRPLILGGSSFGGMVAFEMAQQMGPSRRPSWVVLVDTPAPASLPKKLVGQSEVLAYFFKYGFEGRFLPFIAELEALPPGRQFEFIRQKANQLKCMHLLPPFFGPKLIGVWLHHQKLMHAYCTTAYDGNICYLAAQDRLAEMPERMEDSWEIYARQSFIVRKLPGDHITLNQVPHVVGVAKHIKDVCKVPKSLFDSFGLSHLKRSS